MKKYSIIIGLMASLSAVNAQLINPPSTLDTNSVSFTNVTMEVWTAYAYTSGNTSSSAAKEGFSYDIYNGFGVTLEIANQATGNVISDMDAYFDYRRKIGNLEMVGGVGFGRDFDNRAYKLSGAFQINYNLIRVGSTYIFAGLRDELGYEFNSTRPVNTTLALVGDAF